MYMYKEILDKHVFKTRQKDVLQDSLIAKNLFEIKGPKQTYADHSMGHKDALPIAILKFPYSH